MSSNPDDTVLCHKYSTIITTDMYYEHYMPFGNPASFGQIAIIRIDE